MTGKFFLRPRSYSGAPLENLVRSCSAVVTELGFTHYKRLETSFILGTRFSRWMVTRKKSCNRTSPGFDKVNFKLVKISNKSIPDVLCRSLHQAQHLSSRMKLGKMVWILREGKDPLQSTSYRPVCFLLSTLGKTLEKMIAEIMYIGIEKTGCITPE